MISFLTLLAAFLGPLIVAAPSPPDANGSPVDLEQTMADLGTGTLTFGYPTRDGVRGHDRSVEISFGDGIHRCYFKGHIDREDEMIAGPAVAVAQVRRGQLVDIEIAIGPLGQTSTDHLNLGRLDSRQVAAFLLAQVPSMRDDTADNAMLGAAIARDADVAAPLLALVRDQSNSSDKRQSAMFWVAALASDKALATLQEVIGEDNEEMEMREAAVFALSQMPSPDLLPLLMEIARNDKAPQLQQAAFFALAEHNTPEVVDLFEAVLLGD